MFEFRKKAKAVSSATHALETMLSLLRFAPPGPPNKIDDALWADPYFIGFFHNVVRYWSRLHLRREPTAEEFGEIFTRSIQDGSGSVEDAKKALDTLQVSFSKLSLAGDFAQESAGSSLAKVMGQTASLSSAAAASFRKDIEPRLNAAYGALEFLKGAEMGLIFVSLVAGSEAYDGDPRLNDARQLARCTGGGLADVASAHLSLTFKNEYKERYAA
jgi:hypothetical protein